MSSARNPTTSSATCSENKKHTEEEQKLINMMQQCRVQSVPSAGHLGQQQGMKTNLPEVIHIPPAFQQFQASLNLPQAAASIIRHSPSSTRTLGMLDLPISSMNQFDFHLSLCLSYILNSSNKYWSSIHFHCRSQCCRQ